MKENFTLESEQFSLTLNFEVFENDIGYGPNTILAVSVFSYGFSASANMDVDIIAVSTFCDDLENIYNSLKGEAKIYETYGSQIIHFSGDGLGHICVSGELCSNGMNGFWQELKFENSIDQTYLPDFIKSLNKFAKQFLK